jgi:hypothetical protein
MLYTNVFSISEQNRDVISQYLLDVFQGFPRRWSDYFITGAFRAVGAGGVSFTLSANAYLAGGTIGRKPAALHAAAVAKDVLYGESSSQPLAPLRRDTLKFSLIVAFCGYAGLALGTTGAADSG